MIHDYFLIRGIDADFKELLNLFEKHKIRYCRWLRGYEIQQAAIPLANLTTEGRIASTRWADRLCGLIL